MAELRLTILGCGSSGGVPRIGGLWGVCDPQNPKNTRRRCSLLVERITDQGTTRVLIDASPDMRMQLLDAQVSSLDAVLFTHAHADHVHGIDDLRQIVYLQKTRLPIYADRATLTELTAKFGYTFIQPPGSDYPPILDMHRIDGPLHIEGAGGAIPFTPIRVQHGRIEALGFRIETAAYLPDVSQIPEPAWSALADLDLWILDALRYTPHPSHAHVAQSLEWIARAAPKHAVLTNMHLDIDYATIEAETPDHITPAFDGMVISLEV